jgi:hypothetical protein
MLCIRRPLAGGFKVICTHRGNTAAEIATTAMTVHVIIGAVVAILAAIELWMMSQIPPRLTTGH